LAAFPISAVVVSSRLTTLEDRVPVIEMRMKRVYTGIVGSGRRAVESCPAAEKQKTLAPRTAIRQKRTELLMIIFSLS